MSDEETELICLPCWRTEVSMHDDPPQVEGWHEHPEQIVQCSWCDRKTNNGIRVPTEGFWL
jgi:hypothetical protein